MDKKDFLLDELKRLSRINNELEKNADAKIEEINKNVLTMCEIVKTL